MSLTPRVLGLAEAGFDPLTISHMLGISFAEVNEALLGQEVGGSGGEEAPVVGVRAFIFTEDGTGADEFLADLPSGYVGDPTEPTLTLSGGPTQVAAAGQVAHVALQGALSILSPVNVSILVTNLDGTQTFECGTPESIDLRERGGIAFDVVAALLHVRGQKGEDLSLTEAGHIVSAAGGTFFVIVNVSLEPAR